MSLLGTLERAARADVSWGPLDDRWYTDAPIGPTYARWPVTNESMKRVSAVWACGALLSETVASLPCTLYRRIADGGKERATDHPVYRTLRYQPNSWMTPMDFFGSGQLHLAFRGNWYARILYHQDRISLWPIHPDLVRVHLLDNGRLDYEVTNRETGRVDHHSQSDILHVRDLSDDGMKGHARAMLAREAIAVAGAAEGYAGKFFANDALGRLVMENPGDPGPVKRNELREAVQEQQAGWANRGKMLVTWGGWTAKHLGADHEKGFLLDPRNFQVADIARFWRIPLFMIGLEEKSTTWGTGVESQKQGFVDFTIKPWLDRWAQALGMALLTDEEREEFFIEFNLNDLVRGDLLARMTAYQIARQIGVFSPNEIRKKENEGPREGGDIYQDTPIGGAPNAAGTNQNTGATAVPAPLIADAAHRIASREIAEVGKRAGKDVENPDKWTAWIQTFYADHGRYVEQVLAPLAASYPFLQPRVGQIVHAVQSSAVMVLLGGIPPLWLAERKGEVVTVLASFMEG